jgi:hypothetical protein
MAAWYPAVGAQAGGSFCPGSGIWGVSSENPIVAPINPATAGFEVHSHVPWQPMNRA